MFRFKTMAVVLLASLLPSPAPAGAEETPFGRFILRDTSDHYQTRVPDPWLIPVSLLERRRDEWSAEEKAAVPEELYGKFLDVVERTRDKGLSGNCNPSEGLGGPHDSTPPEVRYTITQIAGTKNNVFTAEVVSTEFAWDGIFHRIVTLVHVKVTKVVQAVEPIAVGDLLTISRPWGKARVRGVILCSESVRQPQDLGPTQAIDLEPEPQQLLLVGNRESGNRFYMNARGFREFRIVDGFVHYNQTYPFYRDVEPEALSEVITKISSRRVGERPLIGSF